MIFIILSFSNRFYLKDEILKRLNLKKCLKRSDKIFQLDFSLLPF